MTRPEGPALFCGRCSSPAVRWWTLDGSPKAYCARHSPEDLAMPFDAGPFDRDELAVLEVLRS